MATYVEDEGLQSRWNAEEASRCTDALALRAYTSRLLGSDSTLVLHGGGNTSIKLRDVALAGGEDILFVKGSGSDLALVAPSDFTPLRLRDVTALIERDELDSNEMYALLDSMVVRHPSPKPSVETLLHAALPSRHVEHTHADPVLAISNTEHGEGILANVYGDLAPTVPYRHSGFELAKACAEVYRAQATERTIGLILRFHGAVAFADDAREAYENMIRLAALAEDYLASRNAWALPVDPVRGLPPDRLAIARLRSAISSAAGFPLVMQVMRDAFALHFASRPDVIELCSQGPATPQHAIFTRRVPLVGDAVEVEAYVSAYRDYLAAALTASDAAQLDPTPRIVVLPGSGICALGVTAEYARIAAEIFRHDMEIMVRAQAHDHYRSAPAASIARAELEYGGFETRERSRSESDKPLLGQVAVVTSAATKREPEHVRSLLARGAAVAIAGRPAVLPAAVGDTLTVFPLEGDTAPAWEAVLDEIVLACGGIDLLTTAPEETHVVERCAPLLALSPAGGSTLG